MTTHKGWTVRLDRGVWLARAWDPDRQAYRSKRHARQGEAKEWAKRQHAIFLTQGAERARRAAGTPGLVDDYLLHLTRLNASESHRRDVRQVLERYAVAVPDLEDPRVLAQTERWLASYASVEHQREPATINRYARTVRALCNWAVRYKRVPSSPVSALEVASAPETVKPQFTVDELRQLVAAEAADDPFHLRFCLRLYAGLRAQEADFLRHEDIDWTGRALVVSIDSGARVKGEKERLVPIQAELLRFLEPRRGGSGPLFPDRSKNQYRSCLSYLRRRGVPIAGRGPHSARHGYAGLMTATGVPSLLLAAYMGHSSTDTTAGYARLALRYVAAVEHWPRGEFRLI